MLEVSPGSRDRNGQCLFQYTPGVSANHIREPFHLNVFLPELGVNIIGNERKSSFLYSSSIFYTDKFFTCPKIRVLMVGLVFKLSLYNCY